MADSDIIFIKLRAENVVSGWLKKSRPTLFVRWKEGRFDVYIATGVPANPELGSDEFTVRIRFDGREAFKQQWDESTDHEALFAPSPMEVVWEIARSKSMLFEFTPFNSPPQIVEFDVHGLARHMDSNFDEWREKDLAR